MENIAFIFLYLINKFFNYDYFNLLIKSLLIDNLDDIYFINKIFLYYYFIINLIN